MYVKKGDVYYNYWDSIIPEDKYARMGVYCIKINNSILYIGKSTNMKVRIVNHLWNITYDNEKKYQLLRELKNKGYNITFDVMKYHNSYSALSKSEGRLINKYLPPLNTQLPKADGSYSCRSINDLNIDKLESWILAFGVEF